MLLVVALALAMPVGEALVGIVTTNLFSVRNLAASWPTLGLAVSAVLMAAGPRLRWVCAGAVVLRTVIGPAKIQLDAYQRPDFKSAAALVDRAAPREPWSSTSRAC